MSEELMRLQERVLKLEAELAELKARFQRFLEVNDLWDGS